MARFGFSVLAVVFFLALFASAAPTPRDGKQAQPANKGSGAIPAEAMQAMKVGITHFPVASPIKLTTHTGGQQSP